MSFLVAIAVAASVVSGEAEQKAAQDNLKVWAEVFSGEWTSESTAKEDTELIKQGDKIVAQWSTKWSTDKEALLTDYCAKVDGNTFITVKGIAGWDALEEAVVMHWFTSLGGAGRIVYTKDGDKWTAKWSAVDAEKKRSTWTVHHKIVDRKTHGTTDTDRIVDGEPKPDREGTAKRK